MEKILKKEILKLRSEGKTYKEIRKILNCTLSVISYHCKNAGMSGELARYKPSKELIEQFNILYKEGKNLKEIAYITKKNRHSISKYIIDYNGKKYVKNISNSQSVVNWRKRKKQELVEYKGGKCQNCGYNKSIEALTFHHRNPLEKDFTIGGKSWSFEKLKNEVDKCDLLCSNCHIELHEKLRK